MPTQPTSNDPEPTDAAARADSLPPDSRQPEAAAPDGNESAAASPPTDALQHDSAVVIPLPEFVFPATAAQPDAANPSGAEQPSARTTVQPAAAPRQPTIHANSPATSDDLQRAIKTLTTQPPTVPSARGPSPPLASIMPTESVPGSESPVVLPFPQSIALPDFSGRPWPTPIASPAVPVEPAGMSPLADSLPGSRIAPADTINADSSIPPGNPTAPSAAEPLGASHAKQTSPRHSGGSIQRAPTGQAMRHSAVAVNRVDVSASIGDFEHRVDRALHAAMSRIRPTIEQQIDSQIKQFWTDVRLRQRD